MSILAIERSLRVLAHLKRHGAARFKDLAALVGPVSPTALSLLLRSLVATGEVVRSGRLYQLSPDSVAWDGGRRALYQLPRALRTATDEILRAAATDLGQSCALFARVGVSTMKIVSGHNLRGASPRFAPLGYEWPLVPFHGFAQVFLAHDDSEDLARDVYYRWRPYLQPRSLAPSYQHFRGRLRTIRRQGYAIEYKEETAKLMRVVLPVRLDPEPQLRFAVGLVTHPVGLLDVERGIERLKTAAASLQQVLAGRVPTLVIDETLPRRPETD